MLSRARQSCRSINRLISGPRKLPNKCLAARVHGGYFPEVPAPPKTPQSLILNQNRYIYGPCRYGLVAGVPVIWEDIDYIPTCLRSDIDNKWLEVSEHCYGPGVMKYFRENLDELPSESFKVDFEKLTSFPGGVGRRGAERIIGLDGGLRLKFFYDVVQEIMEYDDVWHVEYCEQEYNHDVIHWVLTGLDSVVSRVKNDLKEAETPLFDKDGKCLVSVKDFAEVVFNTTKFSSWGAIKHRSTRDTAIYQLGELYRGGLQMWKEAKKGAFMEKSVCKLPSIKSYEAYLSAPGLPCGEVGYEKWFWDTMFKQRVCGTVNTANGAAERGVGLEVADWITFKEANTGPWARELDRRIAIDKDVIEDEVGVSNFNGEPMGLRAFQTGYSAANSKDFEKTL